MAMLVERKMGWVAWGLVGVCAVLLAPLIPAVVLSIWIADLVRPFHGRLARALGGRVRLAATIAVVLLLVVVVPFALVVVSLAFDAYELIMRLSSSPQAKQMLEQLVARDGSSSEPSVWQLVLSQQERAWPVLQQLAGTATRAGIGLFIIITGTYAVLVRGADWYGWFEQNGPIAAKPLSRLRDAFLEAGRGLFIGIGGAGLAQAIIATVIYFALSVPHALELGMLTFAFSIIPAIGTAVVWVPIAIGLALADRSGAAIILAVLGVGLIGSIDNVVKPMLARRGNLQLPTFAVLLAMFAGVRVMGAWGLVMAPLAVRLAKAALEERAAVVVEP